MPAKRRDPPHRASGPLGLAAKGAARLRLTTGPEIAALFAHELNQPLTALLMSAQACARLARKGTAGTRLPKLLDEVVRKAEEAARLVRLLRDFAQGRPTAREEVDVEATLRAVLADMEQELGKRKVRVSLQCPARLPPVRANRVQLSRVFANLLRNALEATDAASTSRRTLDIRARAMAGEVEIAIMDRGPGFSTTNGDSWPQPFRSTKAQGLGLGLALCEAMLQEHAGHLRRAARAGRGTTVRVSLPQARVKS
jgi:two-component system sensor kinase FixL